MPIAVNFSAIASSVSRSFDGTPPPGRVGDVLIVDVPSVGGPLALVVEFLEQSKSGAFTLSGRVDGIDASSFSLTHSDKKALLGKIRIAGLTIVISPRPSSALDSSAHILSLIDPALLKQDPNDVVTADRVLDKVDRKSSPSKQSSYIHSSSGSSGSGDVQVLFLFASDVTNQSSRAANIVSEMNFALQQSGIDQLSLNKISEAGIKTLATDFDGECRRPIVFDMADRNPPFSNLDSWLTSYDADIAFLVTSTDDSLVCEGEPPATIGRIGGIAFVFDPTRPVGLVTDTYAIGDLTAPHEIGHMLGGQHANDESPVPTLPGGDGAHGLENDNAGSWQTIMGGIRPRDVFLRKPSSILLDSRVRDFLISLILGLERFTTAP